MSDGPDRDTIDEGKRLIRAAGTPGESLAGRFDAWLQRLSWRTPLHAMRLKGRHPLKLIAVPDDPLVGDVRRGQALLGGSLLFRGESHAIVALDATRGRWSPAFADYWFLAFVPFMFVGLLLLPSARRTRTDRIKLILDALIVGSGTFMVLWYLLLGPIYYRFFLAGTEFPKDFSVKLVASLRIDASSQVKKAKR